jgi:hypothetical protein
MIRPMSSSDRTALADAIRDMRRVGIGRADLLASGAPRNPVDKTPRLLLRPRLATKAVRS